MRRLTVPCVLAGLLIGAVTGCGGRGLVPVSGAVVMNGNPVERANVMFLRESGEGGAAAFAVTNEEGRFELMTNKDFGALPGEYKVTVQKDSSAYMVFPDPLPPGVSRSGYMQANNMIPYPMLPVHYGRVWETPLHFEVSQDAKLNEFKIELEGKVPAPPPGKQPNLDLP